jgi:hypothetical protein
VVRRPVRLRDRTHPALVARRLARPRCQYWEAVEAARAAAAPRMGAVVRRRAARATGLARHKTRRAAHHRRAALGRPKALARRGLPAQPPSPAERPRARLLARAGAGFCRARSQSQHLQPLRDQQPEKPPQPQRPREALHDDSTHFARQIDPQPNAMLSGRRSRPTEAHEEHLCSNTGKVLADTELSASSWR